MTQSTPTLKRVEELRSQRWLAGDGMRTFSHRARLAQTGWNRSDFMGRPVIGILNTWSDISTCHSHLRERAQKVREGIIRAGGWPIELPAMSLGEVWVKPTTMLYRNFLAMEAEELIRSHPIDGVVLMGGCDKTTPALLMGAFSVNVPCIFIPAGASSNASFRGEKVGTGTHTMKYWNERRAGRFGDDDWQALEGCMTRSPGTCNTAGTASTMTAVAEVLGFTLPGAQSIPAMDAHHPRMCSEVGERIVAMVFEDLKPRDIATEASFHNAVKTVLAIGGSTNACVHLPAMAGRVGVKLPIDVWERYNNDVPVLANIMPAGHALMEDFFFAGGLCAMLSRMAGQLDLTCRTVNGRSLGENIANAKVFDDDVIRPLDNPVARQAIAVVKGNLAPRGAIMKPSAASPHLLQHTGPAVVFENFADMVARIDSPDLDVSKDSVLVLKNVGPVGAPGMPEAGNLPIPKKLLNEGVRDMVRISDARMSGTHYGTCVLHVCPEAAVGGALALVQNGDLISLDVAARKIELLVSEDELATRFAAWQQAKPATMRYNRSYAALYQQHVTQADEGADFDFLQGSELLPEPTIF
ncbi:MAG: dihydroxy-acid dehydratase [Betaproteobacteria bacterium]|nr:MAG: dihydroxy-acid dehydratase [Betaproteobacteria bacterium]